MEENESTFLARGASRVSPFFVTMMMPNATAGAISINFGWTGPNNFTSIEQNPTVSVAGTYVLTVTGENGCTSVAQAEVGTDYAEPGAQAEVRAVRR
jgi:hypothetical protein